MFSDQFLEKEDNTKILEVIFDFLTSDRIELNKIDSEDPEITDYHMIPNTPMLSDRLRTCLQVRVHLSQFNRVTQPRRLVPFSSGI